MNPNSPNETLESPNPRRARDEVQLMLGQIHGVVWLAVNDAEKWIEFESGEEVGEPPLTAGDLHRAALEVHPHFGVVQAALNTGAYDEDLVKAGLTGEQGQAKKKGFWRAAGQTLARPFRNVRDYAARFRKSLKWSGTIVGSVGSALKKEIEKVPGAAAAAEAIKEFIEVLLNVSESAEPAQEAGGAQAGRQGKKGAAGQGEVG
jgi:hypothetical protein